MSFAQLAARRARILTEGSVYELLRRDSRLTFDTHIAHAGLIYDDASRALLADVHRRYLEIGVARQLPMLAFTDTWRASERRVAASVFAGRNVNRDNVTFLRGVAADLGGCVYVAGMSGPAGDGYQPANAPSRGDAARMHRPQIHELSESGVDVLFAATLPALDEALGIADVMASTGLPWIVSFVVRSSGTLLDGTSLAEAILALDSISPNALGISINCVHPTVASHAISNLDPSLAARIIAFQANTSTLAPEDLDGRAEIDGEDPDAFARSLAAVADSVPIVGGCCGTDMSHMLAVGDLLSPR